MRNKFSIAVLLLMIFSCKEECWVCQTECVEFTENYFLVKRVCLTEYVDTFSYQNQVDSFSQLYESDPAQKYGETLCEDRSGRLQLLQSLFGYRCFEK